MEKSHSGMTGHGMPAVNNNTKVQKATTKKQPNGTKFQHSKMDGIFNLVKLQDEKVHIVVGDNIVSQKAFKTFKQADEYIASKPYEILINVSVLISNTLRKNEDKEIQPKNEAN